MFERFTERARRVIFFARYEASQYGSTMIETEHLLLGALKEDRNLIRRFLETPTSVDTIRSEIEKHFTVRGRTSTVVDLPMSKACKRVLLNAWNDANVLNDDHVGVEHLLMAILREEESVASRVLRACGLDASIVREGMSPNAPRHRVSVFALPEPGCVPDGETAVRIAEAVWLPIFGSDVVGSQQPFRADLADRVWTVRGSQRDPAKRSLIAQIDKNDGRILKLGEEWTE